MRRCTTHPSTDPSNDNRTIASTLKMQIWIATNNRDMPRVMKTKFPAMVRVFGVVSSEGCIMPPHIFKVSLKVNTKVYLYVLKSVVIPWCNQVANGRPWVWQQDLVPAHRSKETQAWLQKECHDWPYSGDLPRPRIGMLSLVTVSPVITAFHSCCLSHHVFDQVNLWLAWVGFETAIF